MSDDFNVAEQLEEENEKLPIDLSKHGMPLDIQIRSIALTLATKHTGDTTITDGNLYQYMKMEGKLIGPLTTEHVINCALIFEQFLWGKWSRNIANEAMEKVMNDLDEELKAKVDNADESSAS